MSACTELSRKQVDALRLVPPQLTKDLVDLFRLESLVICCLQIGPKGDLASRFGSGWLASTPPWVIRIVG